MEATRFLQRQEEQFPWIKSEKRHFGSGDYSFDGVDVSAMRKEYEAIAEKAETLKGKAKPQVGRHTGSPPSMPFSGLQHDARGLDACGLTCRSVKVCRSRSRF